MITLGIVLALASAPVVDAVVVKAVKEETTKEIQPRSVRASSFLKNGWNAAEENYLAMYVADDNAKTAWVEGAVNHGEGEWLEWIGPRLEKAKRYVVYIKNGYQKSPQLYKANSRASRMNVELVVDGKPLGGVAPFEVTLKDEMGWQRIELPIAGAPRAVAGLRFTLKEIVAGKTYTDTCVSDVRVFVDGDDRYQGAAEALAQEQVRRFAAERALAAKELNAKGKKGQELTVLAPVKDDDASAFADAPVLPKLGPPPSSMKQVPNGWRRVAAQFPPGAKASADTLGGWRGEAMALLYPFIRREAVTYFDTTDPMPALEQRLTEVRAKEKAAEEKFVARCERERRKERAELKKKGEAPVEYDCDCKWEFYGCGGEMGGEALNVERDVEGARISGVFLPVDAPLLSPTKVLVTHAEYLGDREPQLIRGTCLIEYTSPREVTAQCDHTHYFVEQSATVEVYRVKLDAKNNITAVYGGEPGKKATQAWRPVVDLVATATP